MWGQPATAVDLDGLKILRYMERDCQSRTAGLLKLKPVFEDGFGVFT